jgi:hypothetical protein
MNDRPFVAGWSDAVMYSLPSERLGGKRVASELAAGPTGLHCWIDSGTVERIR